MITLKQLASQLNVSVSTVSKALNNSSEISQLTIDRVKKLADYYNYRPNQVALNLKNNETNTIGVIIPSILNRFFAKVLHGIEKEATKNGFNIITCLSNESLDKEIKSLELLTNGSVDGLLLAVSEETIVKSDYTHFEKLKNKVPLVMFDRVLQDYNCDKVIIDDFETVKKVTQKLIDKGRKELAFVSTIDDLNVGKKRKQGFVEIIKSEFRDSKTPLILTLNEKSNLHEELLLLFKKNPRIDGIISADNKLGTIALNIAKELGYSIPEELSIIGFADKMISEMSIPKLSYINQNAERIGSVSTKFLIERLNSKKEPNNNFRTEIIPIEIFDQ